MRNIKKILCIALMFCFMGTAAYGLTYETLSEDIIKDNLEETYGINIIIPNQEDYISYKDCLLVLERGLSRFPDGAIKEITEFYSKSGIITNVILSKTEKISDLFAEYVLNENSANIYINTMQNSFYYDTCVASEKGFIHEMGHYVSDYLVNVYGYEKIKVEFDKLNEGYMYGTWKDGYENVFINKHSAKSFKDEIADLIWYTEVNPNLIRNINDGNYTVIHKKIEYLASVIDQSFSSITSESKLWHDALPQKPDDWALEAIKTLNESSLIPVEFEGMYNSYITKEDFYTLALNIIENKLGEEKFIKSFELTNKEDFVSIDPINGEIYLDNGDGKLNLDDNICDKKERRLYEAHQIGLIDEGWALDSKAYMTRLEIAKLIHYIAKELGMNISDYKVVNYDDISNISDTEKPFIYFVSSNGLLNGDGKSFNPYDYCTYQEAYLMLMRLYNIL